MLQKSIKQIDVKQLNILQCYMKIKHFNVHMTSNKSYYSHKLENKFSKLPGTDLFPAGILWKILMQTLYPG